MMSAYLLELIDRGDAVGVDGDQADAVRFSRSLRLAASLAMRRRLSDAGRADQRDDVRAGRSWCG